MLIDMRVFLPLTWPGLGLLHVRGRLGNPAYGHAVTAELVAQWTDSEDEERDYAVLMAAGYDSLLALAADPAAPPRRVVLAVDVPDGQVHPSGPAEITAVTVTGPVELAQVKAIFVDDPGAAPDVRAALAAVPAATGGDPVALAVVALDDHELAWYATQEITDLLA